MSMTKAEISAKMQYEIKALYPNVSPYCLAQLDTWVRNRWSVNQCIFSEHLEHDYWEWKPIKSKGKLIIQSDRWGVRLYINGKLVHSNIVNLCWRSLWDRLPQAKVNELLGYDSLFDLESYDVTETDSDAGYKEA